MAAPIRSVVSQGTWYAVGNALSKVGGLILLPLYTNTEFLSKEDFGLWGTFEVTAQIAIGVVGLQLAYALIRYYAEPNLAGKVPATAWWATVGLALVASLPVLLVLRFAGTFDLQPVYELLVVYVAMEILLTIPLAVLRVRDQAGRYTGLILFKLALIIGINLYLVRVLRLGLPGLMTSYAIASTITLVVAGIMTAPEGLFRFSIDRVLLRRMLRFSLPLVLAGLGSMVLNASDRYVLLAFRTKEEVGLYTLAAKFGGVINMLAAQPLQLALLPILFRLKQEERDSFLSNSGKYLVLLFCLLTLLLTAFTEPVLHVFRSDPFYEQSVSMVPWIALGFAFFGLSIVMDGILTLHEKTGLISFWIAVAAVLNVGLNFLVVPWLGALGAALSTFASYFVLLVGKYLGGSRLQKLSLPMNSMIWMALTCVVFAVGSVYITYPEGIPGLLLRALVVAGWLMLVLLAGWIRMGEIKNLMRAFIPARQTP